jgi:hypothetical protein
MEGILACAVGDPLLRAVFAVRPGRSIGSAIMKSEPAFFDEAVNRSALIRRATFVR